MKKFLFLLLFSVLPSISSAQQVIKADADFSVVADHDGQAMSYRVKIDSMTKGADRLRGDVFANGVVTIPIVGGVAAGDHNLSVCAVNEVGEACSTPIPFIAKNPPTPPSNLRFIVEVRVSENGVMELKLVQAQ